MNTPPAGKKHKLSRLLGPKEVKGPVVPEPDSTYGSSESHPSDIVRVENDGTIPNTNREQNLALDKGTGEVFVSCATCFTARSSADCHRMSK